jgi:phosphoribosylformylglycinamidine (FGAM) synthase-like enzyme
VLKMHGEIEADMPVGPLVDEAPLYDRPGPSRRRTAAISIRRVPAPALGSTVLKKLIACPDLASKRWIWEQYDAWWGDTAQAAGRRRRGRAGARHGKALALTHRLHAALLPADPERGGKQAVAEAWRNLTAVGATADRAHRQHEFRQPGKARDHGPVRRRAIEGMAEACLALDFPVVSGNVSLYNETSGERDPADPGDRRVGLIDDAARPSDLALR